MCVLVDCRNKINRSLKYYFFEGKKNIRVADWLESGLHSNTQFYHITGNFHSFE